MHIFSHSSFIRYLGTLGKNDLLKWITNKVLLYSTGNSAQCYTTAWMGGEFGGECVCVCVLVIQSCLTLCEPIDCSPPGSSVHRILQAGRLKWVAISFSRESS